MYQLIFFFQFKPNLTKTQPHVSLVLLPRTPKFLGNAPVPQRQQVLKPAQIKILGSTPRQWNLSIRRTYQELRSVEKLVGLNGPMPVRSAGSEWTPGSLWQESLIAYTKHILMKWKIDLKKKLKLLRMVPNHAHCRCAISWLSGCRDSNPGYLYVPNVVCYHYTTPRL